MNYFVVNKHYVQSREQSNHRTEIYMLLLAFRRSDFKIKKM